jgi:hypothetical protein
MIVSSASLYPLSDTRPYRSKRVCCVTLIYPVIFESQSIGRLVPLSIIGRKEASTGVKWH